MIRILSAVVLALLFILIAQEMSYCSAADALADNENESRMAPFLSTDVEASQGRRGMGWKFPFGAQGRAIRPELRGVQVSARLPILAMRGRNAYG